MSGVTHYHRNRLTSQNEVELLMSKNAPNGQRVRKKVVIPGVVRLVNPPARESRGIEEIDLARFRE
jgi:hypothetical protein